MGSATTQAVATTTAALDATPVHDLGVARDLFAAARALGGAPHLSDALADSAAAESARVKVVTDVFGGALSSPAVSLLTTAVRQSWSSSSDLIDGIEELAVRAAVKGAPDADVESELFGFSRTVTANPELELALGSRMGDGDAKGALVTSLLSGRTSAAATLIVSALVRQPRGRRVRELLARGMRVAANERGRTVATVRAAVELTATQRDRLAATLAKRYGTLVSVNTVVDPTIVGGLRVQIADDVIDGSIATRMSQLRQRLAG
jgi:F-type H+-transporting ATPase subunit delta